MLSSLKHALGNLTDGKAPSGQASSHTAPAAPSSSSVLVLDQGHPALPDSRHARYTVGGFELEGVSISGQETCIILPRAKVCFDIGRCPQRAVIQQTVLITHGHLDHIGGAPFHVASRAMAGTPPSKLVALPAYVDGLKGYLDAGNALQGASPLDYTILPLQAGQELQLPSGFICRPFSTTHTIPSQGYVLYSERKKLRADLQGRSQAEIRDLRLAGEEVQEVHQVPEVAFTGDTTAAFLQQPGMQDVLSARLLIMEMTFIDASVTVEEAREKGHMHIVDMVANAHLFQNETILLIHFSPRYKRSEIVEKLNMSLPPQLRAKCIPWLNGFAE